VAAKSGKIEKELKAPDQFVSFWAQVGKQIGEHRKTLLVALGAGVAVVAVAAVVSVFLTSRAEKTSQAFARIHRIASAPVVASDSPDKPAPDSTGSGPSFKTSKDRAEAALKEVDAFLADHGGSKLRDEALLQKGRLLLLLGRAPEAVTLYSGLVNDVDERFRFLAEEGLAYAYEASGNVDKAIETNGALADHAKGAGNFFRDRALFNKARLLEGKGAGSVKDAEKIYREILAETPTSVLKEEINSRLALIENK
jgi:tetratricopeptide (TPR) repeat protein